MEMRNVKLKGNSAVCMWGDSCVFALCMICTRVCVQYISMTCMCVCAVCLYDMYCVCTYVLLKQCSRHDKTALCGWSL